MRTIRQPDRDHPITISPFAGRVTVRVGEETIADTTKALALAEGRYPIVYYIPQSAVDGERLAASDRTTWCPFKGEASYFSIVTANGARVEDAVWIYRDPADAVRRIKGYLAFYPEKVDIRAEPSPADDETVG